MEEGKTKKLGRSQRVSESQTKHKKKYGEALSRDLSQDYHKRQYYRDLCDELMCIAWHPHRYWDWCVPEDEKKELEKYLT